MSLLGKTWGGRQESDMKLSREEALRNDYYDRAMIGSLLWIGNLLTNT